MAAKPSALIASQPGDWVRIGCFCGGVQLWTGCRQCPQGQVRIAALSCEARLQETR